MKLDSPAPEKSTPNTARAGGQGSEAVLSSPEKTFESPESLAASSNLSTSEKVEALERWRTNQSQMLRADGEGMAPPPRAEHAPKPAEVIRSIDRELESLRNKAAS